MAGVIHIRKRNEIELQSIGRQSNSAADASSTSTIRNKIKYGGKGAAIWGLFSEYCHNSSIHGVKYLGEPKRSIAERLFWVSIFAFSIYGCMSVIHTTWKKWQQNPVIVSFNEKSTPVWQIPFPAITICPELKFQQDKYNFSNVLLNIMNSTKNMTEKEKYYTDVMAHVCDYETLREINNFINNETSMFKDRPDYMELSTVISVLEELLPHADRPFDACSWQSKTTPCRNLFRKILTKEGICFSFNILDSKYLYREETVHNDRYLRDNSNWFQDKNEQLEWNIEDGYDRNATKTSYPYRSLGAGSKSGLFLWLYGTNQTWDKVCRGPILGFKLLLHSPDELDDVSSQYIQVPLGQQILISIKPKILHTSDRVKTYPPAARQCFFQDERHLRFFKYYNQKNCQLECLTNFTLEACGCVRFDMPRLNDTPICGLRNWECYNEAEYNLYHEDFRKGCQHQHEIFNCLARTTCNCLPACTSIGYETEITQASYNVTTHFETLLMEFSEEFHDISEMTRLFLFFKETQFLSSKRSELYGPTDFLANCGGLLGLFMGVSTLSLVELIYFCTIRLGANIKMRAERKLSRNNNKIVNYDGFK